jgi:hypothetical protein
MAELTFRDFAAAIMKNDVPAAGGVLQSLLGLDAGTASTAAQYFAAQSAAQGPAFMGQAMQLRTTVASGNQEETEAVLKACFGLTGETVTKAAGHLLYKP